MKCELDAVFGVLFTTINGVGFSINSSRNAWSLTLGIQLCVFTNWCCVYTGFSRDCSSHFV